MLSIPDSLSFAKLMIMSFAPAKSAGDARYAPQDPFIHLYISLYVERNDCVNTGPK